MTSTPKKKKSAGKKTVAKKAFIKRKTSKPIVQPRAFTLVKRISSAFHEEDAIRIILDVAGHFDMPTNKPGIKSKKLKENLNYTANLLQILVIELNKYVKTIKSDAAMDDNDIAGAQTVQDILDVVAAKVK